MTRLPRVSGKQVLQALERNGFALSHVRGAITTSGNPTAVD